MESENRNFLESLIFPLALIVVLWLIEMAKYVFQLDMGMMGIHPRSFKGLLGIFTSPLVHANASHLISNSIPLLVLCTILMHFFRPIFYKTFGSIYILTGILVWIFARKYGEYDVEVYHIGASGVVYGLVAFIFWVGVFTRNRVSIVLSLIMIFLYSGLFLGIIPNDNHVSWESHLLGGLSGVLFAFAFRSEIIDVEEESDVMEDVDTTYFLPRDIFDKTKEEREQEALNNEPNPITITYKFVPKNKEEE